MSAQTGTLPPSGPASRRTVDRARFRLARLLGEPNPIWMRELKQAARLTRTPLILTALTMLVAMGIASIGGVVSARESPATTGVVLFQVFFSVAFFVVTLVGPAVAANSIASEREGHTWEAVILTGLSPDTIARGKFLAAFTAIGMYVVMLAPVGALPFLFGGVTATETVMAFAILFLVAVLSVAFGLAVSSKMASLRGAIVLTLLAVVPLAVGAFSLFGVGLSYLAHRAWIGVDEGAPIWLPAAYARAPFDRHYVVFLLALPLTLVALPAWFLHQVTIANLSDAGDDRSSGLRRWFLVAAPVLTLAAVAPVLVVRADQTYSVATLGLTLLALFFAFAVFLFAGDPLGPSRRVLAEWSRDGASRFRRFLGPGVPQATLLLLPMGTLCMAALTLVTAFLLGLGGRPDQEIYPVVLLGAYAIAFFIFLAGLAAFLRSARPESPMFGRVVLVTIVFAVVVGPWVVAAIAGIITEGSGNEMQTALVVAAPSPFYVILMGHAHEIPGGSVHLLAGTICMVMWAGLGLALAVLASRRAAAVLAKNAALVAETERVLAAEDAALLQAQGPVEAP